MSATEPDEAQLGLSEGLSEPRHVAGWHVPQTSSNPSWRLICAAGMFSALSPQFEVFARRLRAAAVFRMTVARALQTAKGCGL